MENNMKKPTNIISRIYKGIYIYLSQNAKELRASFMLGKYYKTAPKSSTVYPAPDGDYCEVITVAFNNALVIDYQITMLEKFFKTPFRYTVFDNSTNEEESLRIEQVCKNKNTGYVRLPKQLYIKPGMASYSHGIALNYIWKNFVSNSNATYWAILDHDIFPVKDFYVEEHLKEQPVYGLKLVNRTSMRVKQHVWFLWAGFGYFRMDYLQNKQIDFRPDWNKNAETGSRNYCSLYQNLNEHHIKSVSEQKVCFGSNNFWENGYAYFDCGWIHMWNGSNYTNSTTWKTKMDNITQLLQKHLEKSH